MTGWTSTRLLRAELAVLAFAVTVVSASPVMAATSEQALEAARAYCMAAVCLGMTVEEVDALEGGKLSMWAPLPEKRNCNGDRSQSSGATFVGKDGQEFNVSFKDYPGPANARMRYRVASVGLYVHASARDFDDLRRTLTERYSLQPSNIWGLDPSATSEWSGSTKGLGIVVVHASYKPKLSLLGLQSLHTDYADWLMSQPECRTRMPKL